MDSDDNIIVLTDEEGKDVSFEFLDLIACRGNQYVVLLPVEEDDGEVLILQYVERETSDDFLPVEDDEIMEEVFGIFKEKFKDEFDFQC